MLRRFALMLSVLLVCLPVFAQQELLKNSGFEQAGANGLPIAWSQYGGGVPESVLKMDGDAHSGKSAVRFLDTGPNLRDDRYTIGLSQDVPVEPGKFYLGSVWTKSISRNHEQAVVLQLSFRPGNQSFVRYLTAPIGGDWMRFAIGGVAPEGATTCRFYIYTMHFWTSETLLDDASLKVQENNTGLNTAIWRHGEEPLQQARPLKLQTALVRNGRPAAIIACPADPAWKQVAMDLQQGLQRKTGAILPVTTDVKPLLKSDQTIIALGNLNNNFIIERLYFNFYTRADSLWPGAGNYALRTVHQPFNFGDINVLTVEASDLEGTKKGVAELLQRLPEGGNCSLDKPLLLVSSTGPLSLEGATKAVEPTTTQDLWCDFWQACQKYRDTGDLAWAQQAKLAMQLAEQRLAANPDYRVTWPEETSSDQIGAMWDVIEEAPVWSDAERLNAINALFATMLSLPRHVTYWGSFVNNETVLFNHSSFPLMGIYFIDRYLNRYYAGETPTFDAYMAQVVGAFRGQVKSWKPQCDADGYLTIVPHHTIEYTLSQNDYTYFENDQVRQFAEYLVAIDDNTGAAPGFGDSGIGKGPAYEQLGLTIALWYYKDPRYLWRLQQIYDNKWQNPYDQTIQPQPWPELIGLTVWPLAPEWYHWASTEPSYDEAFVPLGVPYDKAFDKIAFRESLDKESPHLLLDGIARGKHLHYDGNAIIKYHADGEDWLVDGDYLVRNTTEHSMLSIIKDGRADTLEPPLASLDAHADLKTCAYTRTSVGDYNGADWSRNILWLKGLGFVLLDEMTPRQDGEYTFESIFKTQDIGEQGLAEGRVFSVLRSTGGGSGSRGLMTVADYSPQVPRVVKFMDQQARLEFPLALPAGRYRVTLFAQGRDSGSDSFFLSVDGGENIAFHIPINALGPSADSSTKDTPSPEVVVAKDGIHIVRISLREGPGPVLQKIVIATPEGKELKTIEAANPPPSSKELIEPAPMARFFIKGDGSVPAILTDRTNNVNLKLRYLHECAGGRLRAGQMVPIANVFYNDRDNKPLNLDLRQSHTPGTWVVLRDNQPWGVLQRPTGNLQRGPEAIWLTADQAVYLNFTRGPLNSKQSISLELNLKTGAATVYATTATTITVNGKRQAIPQGQSQLDLRDLKSLKMLQQACARTFAQASQSLVAPGATWGDEVHVPTLSPLWQLPAVKQDDETAVINRLVSADINGDGVAELLVGWGHSCVCLDAHGKQLWSVETGARVNDMCTADLNSDGKPEVLIGSDDEYFYIVDGNGKLLSKTHCDAPLRVGTSSVRDPRVSNVAVADIDGDGKLDIIIATRNGNVCRYDTSLNMLWRFNQIEHGTLSMRLLDLNGDGKLEIVAANRYGSVEVVDYKGSPLPNTYSELGDVVFDVADLDGDTKPEIVNGSSTGALTCTKWGGSVLWRFDNFGYGARDVRIGDFDGDGKLETALASDTGYVYLLEQDGKTKASQRLSNAVLSLAVTPTANGNRLIAGCRDGRVYLLDGALKPQASFALPGPVTRLAVQQDPSGKSTLLAAGGEALAAIAIP